MEMNLTGRKLESNKIFGNERFEETSFNAIVSVSHVSQAKYLTKVLFGSV